MDRSNSLNTNFRTLADNKSPYEKLTLRLTPKIMDSKGIIRIPAKNTPTTNYFVNESYSQIKKNDWMNLVSPTKQSPNSPATLIPNSPPIINQADQTINSSKITKSYLSSSTVHDLEAESKLLKGTVQNQKNTIKELEDTIQKLSEQLLGFQTKASILEDSDLKHKLQQTEQRMGEENAYLRDCMFKLHQQIQQIKVDTVGNMRRENNILQQQNRNLMEDVRTKGEQVSKVEQRYQNLVQYFQKQRVVGQKVNQKLSNLETNILRLQGENRKLRDQLQHSRQTNEILSKRIEHQRQKSQVLVSDNSNIRKDMENHRQIAEQLRSSNSKLRQQNLSLNKSMESITPKNLSAHRFSHYQQRSSFSKIQASKNRSLSKMSSMTHIYSDEGDRFEFEVCHYISKSQELKNIKANLNNQRDNSQLLAQLLKLAEYFDTSVDKLLNQKVNTKQLMDKYKKLVQIVVQNPKSQTKTSEFINQLIQKCNLLESSMQEKKDTIESLQEHIISIKKQRISEEIRINRHYKPQQEEERQKMINHRSDRQKYKEKDKDITQPFFRVSKNTQAPAREITGGISATLERLKQFKPGNLIQQRENYNRAKLQNLNEQDSLSQMQSKLKVYEGEINSKLESQIVQDSNKEKDNKELNDSVLPLDSSHQSQQNLQQPFRNSRLFSHSFDKRKQRQLVGLSQPFKQCQGQKPGTAESVSVYNSKKKRLDLIGGNLLSKEVVMGIILKLTQIAQTMTKNSNFMTILPDSIYIINYSEDSLSNIKLKVLQSSKSKTEVIKKYWAPENTNGNPLNQLSLVWNIGLILDQIISGKGYFQKQCGQKLKQLRSPFFKKMVESMLEQNPERRIRISSIQQLIIKEDKVY